MEPKLGQSEPVSLGVPERTAKVIVRHNAKCKDRGKGIFHRDCRCRKSILMYDGVTRAKNGRLTNKVVSAKTKSWDKAETIKQEWLDSFDPEKIELKQLRAKKEAEQVRIEDAVAKFDAENVNVKRLAKQTVWNYRSVLGYVDPETLQVKRDGLLFRWIGKRVPRPVFLGELTQTVIGDWRASWTNYLDSSAKERWKNVKAFFNFCEQRGLLALNPTRGQSASKVAKGSRTMPFSDDQYTKILKAATDQRLMIFLELMRWSGMDTIDAAKFRSDLVDDDGVLRYARQKTGENAVIPLPDHVVILLRDVPLAPDSLSPDEPFRTKRLSPEADARKWRSQLKLLFKSAGITSVKTDLRVRDPGSKMLRDTFSVWHFRQGVPVESVAKMLGHKDIKMTIDAYRPWIKTLDDAHIAAVRKTMKTPKKRTRNIIAIA
jgi:integrase